MQPTSGSFQNNGSGIKSILGAIALVAILVVGFLVWLDYREIQEFDSPAKLAAHSPLIVVARFDTNATSTLIVTEIWKQPNDLSAQSIKVGTKIPFFWNTNNSTLPDGEVIFYRRSWHLIGTSSLGPIAEYLIRQGQVDGMTIQQFKTACGL